MRHPMHLWLFAILAGGVLFFWSLAESEMSGAGDEVGHREASHRGEGEDLLPHMANLQRFSHKLGLSLEAQNGKLAVFYAGEMKETVETIEKNIPEYDGNPVGLLVPTMLKLPLDRLKEASEKGDMTGARSAYSILIQSCNQCHMTTKHEFIKIMEGWGNNPFNQDFGPQEPPTAETINETPGEAP